MSPDALSQHPLRPRDLATLLLASGDLLPRQRARDQQADIAGGELKRRVLRRLVELDPEPAALAGTLEQITQELGEPTGPTRAIARTVLEEFRSTSPTMTQWLLDQALRNSAPRESRPPTVTERSAEAE